VVAGISISFIVISTVALCLNTLSQFQHVDLNGNVKVSLNYMWSRTLTQ
jgi:hypothetical protein